MPWLQSAQVLRITDRVARHFQATVELDADWFLSHVKETAAFVPVEGDDHKSAAVRRAAAMFYALAASAEWQADDALGLALCRALVTAQCERDGYGLVLSDRAWMRAWTDAGLGSEFEDWRAVALLHQAMRPGTQSNPSARELATRAGRGVASAARWAAPRAKAAAQATGRAVVRGARWAAPRAKAAAKATGRAVVRGAKRAAPHVARGLRGTAERLDRFARSNPCKGKCPPGKTCKRCCAHRLQASPMELEVVAHELEREMRGPHIPLPSELEFPHAEGDALCCAEHPVWRKVHELAEGYREEGFTEEEVAAALQATPRLEAVYELEAHCVNALKRRARAKKPKGDVDALERASRRRKHLAAGGDTTGAEWRDTLKTRRRRNPARWAWRSGPYQCGCRHTTPAAAEACARRNVAEGIVHLVAVA